jgi:hypothetical protein
MVVAFNLLMIALAAMTGGSIEAPFLAVWIGGDFALSLLALALTECWLNRPLTFAIRRSSP